MKHMNLSEHLKWVNHKKVFSKINLRVYSCCAYLQAKKYLVLIFTINIWPIRRVGSKRANIFLSIIKELNFVQIVLSSKFFFKFSYPLWLKN